MFLTKSYKYKVRPWLQAWTFQLSLYVQLEYGPWLFLLRFQIKVFCFPGENWTYEIKVSAIPMFSKQMFKNAYTLGSLILCLSVCQPQFNVLTYLSLQHVFLGTLLL